MRQSVSRYIAWWLMTISAISLTASVRPGESRFLVPGDTSMIAFYTDFYFKGPERDFLFHLNERLLALEKPSGPLLAKGLRAKLLKISQWSRVLKRSFQRLVPKGSNVADVDITNSRSLENVRVFLDQAGLLLEESGGYYRVRRAPSGGQSDYYKFARFNESLIELELNRDKRFRMVWRESRLEAPCNLDFLEKVTGLELNSDFFFDVMLENKRFSLLLAVLHRLSPREIDWISRMPGPRGVGAWSDVYRDGRLLMGMYVLSAALRVDGQDRLRLPGGPSARGTWKMLAGCDPYDDPSGFIVNIAAKDNGKLDYLYLFTYFLSPGVSEVLLGESNRDRLLSLWPYVALTSPEVLTDRQFPVLREAGFFLLLYTLQARNGDLMMTPSASAWLDALGLNRRAAGESGETSPHPLDFVKKLLQAAGADDGEELIRKCITLRFKFQDRPQWLTSAALPSLIWLYDNSGIMLDYLEKIPVRKTETVEAAKRWLKAFDELAPDDYEMFTAISQALLEYIVHVASGDPGERDYDRLFKTLAEIPLQRAGYYDKICHFLETSFGVRSGGMDLLDPVLGAFPEPKLTIGGAVYLQELKEFYRRRLVAVLESQEIGASGALLEINRLLRQLERQAPAGLGLSFNLKLQELLGQLPYAEISENAPGVIRKRVMAYSRETLLKYKVRLAALFNPEKPASVEVALSVSQNLKQNILLHHLKNWLTALAYALNAREPELKIFLNPNVTRMHDFSYNPIKREGPWNYSGSPDFGEDFSEYHFRGGLSRLPVLLAPKLQDLMVKGNVYKHTFLQPLMINMISFYPMASVRWDILFNGLLADYGLHVLQQARNGDLVLREKTIRGVSVITSGFNYRNVVQFIQGVHETPGLFNSELSRLGFSFLDDHEILAAFPRRDEMDAYLEGPLKNLLNEEKDYKGQRFPHTFGCLTGREIRLFPQEIARLFGSGWLGGEIFDEYYIRTGTLLQRMKCHPLLFGVVLYEYIKSAFPVFYNQNHTGDYYTAHAMFDFFNESCLDAMIQNLKKEGYLKLQ